jgi:hypothetical protein
MKRWTPLVILVAALPILFQCAGTSEATPEQNEAAQAFAIPEGTGVVYVFRPGRALGAALQIQIQINGIDAGGTGPGTYFRWELKPGRYTFASRTSESSVAVQVDLEAGQMVFIEQNPRIGIESGRVTLKVVDEAAGKRAVRSSKLLVSAYVPED